MLGESEDSQIRMSGCRCGVRRPGAASQRPRQQQRERGEECKQQGSECELNHASIHAGGLAGAGGAWKQEPPAASRARSDVASATFIPFTDRLVWQSLLEVTVQMSMRAHLQSIHQPVDITVLT